jgi:branched-chain amino acid transport system substrate-binding protein
MQKSGNAMRCLGSLLFAIGVAGVAGPAWSDVHIAQVTPMTGPIAVEGKGANVGIKVAIDAANARGGVAGHKIIFRTEDDEYKPAKAVSLIRDLAQTETLALLMPVGSPSMTKILQDRVLESTGIPIVGLVPGAEPLRNPINPYVYHVRAGDLDQYRKLVRNALTIGLKQIAVVYADIPFGKAGLAAVESMLKEASLEPVARVPISVAAGADHSQALKPLKEANPSLIVLVSPGQIAGDFLKAYRGGGLTAQVTTLSYGDPDTLCRIASPERARGVSVAQILPNIRNTTLPLARQFQEDFQKYGPKDLNPSVLHFEGYVAAKTLFEGIKRINGTPTREKLIKALDSMQRVDLGGFVVDFSPTKHTGSSYVEIGVISKDCKVLF